MSESIQQLQSIVLQSDTPRNEALRQIREVLKQQLGYDFLDVDETKPWGAYYRMIDGQADRFVNEFFPGLSPSDARFGRLDVELSPKILVVCPGQRLSWQYHDRRAERWHFLTGGGYHRSKTDDQGNIHWVNANEIVQFETTERHRLCGLRDGYTLVAEIWQHTDAERLSNEADIVRVADDYKR